MFNTVMTIRVITAFIAALLLTAPVPLSHAQGRGPTGPDLFARLAHAIEVQQRHTDRLLEIGDIVGTAVGLADDGEPVVKIFTRVPKRAGIPNVLDGMSVVAEATGEFFALPSGKSGSRSRVSPSAATATVNPWYVAPPAPIGVSTGNGNICLAGTIGARVKNGSKYYALSNNHVYARENKALIGEQVLQPGLFDAYYPSNDCTGTGNLTQIGTLSAFETIKFGCRLIFIFYVCDRTKDNTIDAAIAEVSRDSSGNLLVGNSTPADGYGTPKSGAGVAAILNQLVQKYGRTTKQTNGKITGINATVVVGYTSGVARFVNQILVSKRSQTDPAVLQAGDSGSLVVTDPDKNPVGLLFAGNGDGSQGIANSIGRVLTRFSVTIDGQ